MHVYNYLLFTYKKIVKKNLYNVWKLQKKTQMKI